MLSRYEYEEKKEKSETKSSTSNNPVLKIGNCIVQLREGDATINDHDGAWLSQFHSCGNPLYLDKDGNVHISVYASGVGANSEIHKGLSHPPATWVDNTGIDYKVQRCVALSCLDMERAYEESGSA